MKSQDSENEKLDRIGKTLLEASILRDDEIEALASQAHLYSAIRSRIISEKVVRPKTFRFSLTMRIAAFSTAVVVAVLIAVTASVFLNRGPANHEAGTIVSKTDPGKETARPPAEPPLKFQPVHTSIPTMQPAIFKSKPATHVASRRLPPKEKPLEFYALAGPSPNEEAFANGRVIRVDLPRASLVALGVNIPLESEKQVIKTDLIVGPDGVPRAIRIVD